MLIKRERAPFVSRSPQTLGSIKAVEHRDMSASTTEEHESSPIHLRKRGFWPRLHEVGKPLTLKEAADNLKNYAVAAAAYAGGVKIIDKSTGYAVAGGYALAVIAVVFFAVTFCQSWVLAQKQAQDVIPFTTSDRIRNGIKPALKLWLYLSIPLLLAFIAISTGIWFARNAA